MPRAIAVTLAVLLLAGSALAQEEKKPPTGGPPVPTGPVTSFKLEGAAVHQAGTDLEEDGDFNVNRFFIQPALDVFFSPKLQASFALGYSLDRYDFRGKKGIAAAEPWDDVDTLRFTALTRYAIDDTWTLFGVPTIQFAAERGASLSDGFTFGVYAGAAWKASETLSIGPGAGFFSEIEDRGVFFPFLVIDWQIADQWSMGTGRGLAATRGPGLALEWTFADRWALGLGSRWEQFRFRLDDDGVAPDGVGEEESVPVFLMLSYRPAERSSVSLLAGMNFYGSVSVFDDRGKRLAGEDYDPTPFLGLAFSLTF